MLHDAAMFMHMTDRPHVHAEVRARIRALADEMSTLYKTHMRQSTGRTCDICGKGDSSEHRRVATVVSGYEHRESDSPCLCFNHKCGWSLSFNTMLAGRRSVPDEQTDLHFALYLAKCLNKQANQQEK